MKLQNEQFEGNISDDLVAMVLDHHSRALVRVMFIIFTIITHTCGNRQQGLNGTWHMLYEGWNFNSGNYLFTTYTK